MICGDSERSRESTNSDYPWTVVVNSRLPPTYTAFRSRLCGTDGSALDLRSARGSLIIGSAYRIS